MVVEAQQQEEAKSKQVINSMKTVVSSLLGGALHPLIYGTFTFGKRTQWADENQPQIF